MEPRGGTRLNQSCCDASTLDMSNTFRLLYLCFQTSINIGPKGEWGWVTAGASHKLSRVSPPVGESR